MDVGLNLVPVNNQNNVITTNIYSLPRDVFTLIFSYLEKKDIQSMVCVSRQLKVMGLYATSNSQTTAIYKFVLTFITGLNPDQCPSEVKSFIEISQNITSISFASLQLLKKYILKERETLINVIKKMDPIDVIELKTVKRPHFMENIFQLASLEVRIDAAKDLPDIIQKASTLRGICRELTRFDSVDRAIEVAGLIPDVTERGFVLRDISKALTESGSIERAIKVAGLIPDVTERGFALRDISKALIKGGNIDKAMEVAGLIPDVTERGFALTDISEALIKGGNIDKAMEVAKLISD